MSALSLKVSRKKMARESFGQPWEPNVSSFLGVKKPIYIYIGGVNINLHFSMGSWGPREGSIWRIIQPVSHVASI